MTNPQTFATELRAQILETIEFCTLLSKDHVYRPRGYRVPLDFQNDAAKYLHTMMGYRADQPEI